VTIVVRTDEIGKQYRVGARQEQAHTLRDSVARVIAAPVRNFQRLRGRTRVSGQDGPDLIWALRDVTFEVSQGEVLGVVGRNGAGKSTLLKVLSRITSPTTGRAWVRGRIGSLLEVGTGFHPELTGRDNIYLNGCILGMDPGYITRRFDEIVDFAGVSLYLDTPVKHYSSGMYLRLAFAVAAHLGSEIMVIDEVLAVGDADFQKKCLAKMSEVAGEGRTILFVSHNLNAIQRMCPRSILLEGGRLIADGPTADVLRGYLALSPETPKPRQPHDLTRAQRTGNHELHFTAVEYGADDVALEHYPYPDGPLEVRVTLASRAACTIGSLGLTLHDQDGARVLGVDTLTLGLATEVGQGTSVLSLDIESLHLNPGIYHATLWASGPRGRRLYDRVEAAFALQVVPAQPVTPGQRGPATCRFRVSHPVGSWNGSPETVGGRK
jgi:ABC-type polysaccharide/polyol phosphate transport system ATPase subunit